MTNSEFQALLNRVDKEPLSVRNKVSTELLSGPFALTAGIVKRPSSPLSTLESLFKYVGRKHGYYLGGGCVFCDARTQSLVASDGITLLSFPSAEPITQTAMVDRHGRVTDGAFPDYLGVVLAHDRCLSVDAVGLLSQLEKLVRINRCLTAPLFVELRFDDQYTYLDAARFFDVIGAMVSSGTRRVLLEFSSRGKVSTMVIVSDVAVPNKFGLIMPIRREAGSCQVRGDGFAYVPIAGGTTTLVPPVRELAQIRLLEINGNPYLAQLERYRRELAALSARERKYLSETYAKWISIAEEASEKWINLTTARKAELELGLSVKPIAQPV